MNRPTFFQSLVVGLLCCVATPVAVASGQGLSSPTFDVAVQFWTGRAENLAYSSQGGLALDAIAAWHARGLSRGALIVGAGVVVEGAFPSGDVCRRFPDGGGCALYPSFSSLTALGGFEGKFGVTARALGGPAVFHALGGANRGNAAGLQGRVDLSPPPLVHVSFVVSARGAWIPNFHGHRYTTGAMGVGIRFQ